MEREPNQYSHLGEIIILNQLYCIKGMSNLQARVVPYFTAPTMRKGAFFSGITIAQSFYAIEDLCQINGWKPLSDFQFTDPRSTKNWSEPKEAIITIRSLIDYLESKEEGEHLKLIQELHILLLSMKDAVEKNAQFCFVVRLDQLDAEEQLLANERRNHVGFFY